MYLHTLTLTHTHTHTLLTHPSPLLLFPTFLPSLRSIETFAFGLSPNPPASCPSRCYSGGSSLPSNAPAVSVPCFNRWGDSCRGDEHVYRAWALVLLYCGVVPFVCDTNMVYNDGKAHSQSFPVLPHTTTLCFHATHVCDSPSRASIKTGSSGQRKL